MKRSPMSLRRCGSAVVLLLLATLASSLVASAACESIRVAGGGYAAANGTYLHTGEAYGKPTYVLGTDYRITWMGKWYLSDFIGGTFYENASSADEPPFSGWVSLDTAYNPAPTLSCADLPPTPEPEPTAPEPKIVGRTYELADGSLTLTYENVGSSSAIVYELCAGPALCAQGADGAIYPWIPDSDLWQIIPLAQAYVVKPGATLTLVLPSLQLPQGWLEEAAARSAIFTGFTFLAPHIAVGVIGWPASWIHLTTACTEGAQGAGE